MESSDRDPNGKEKGETHMCLTIRSVAPPSSAVPSFDGKFFSGCVSLVHENSLLSGSRSHCSGGALSSDSSFFQRHLPHRFICHHLLTHSQCYRQRRLQQHAEMLTTILFLTRNLLSQQDHRQTWSAEQMIRDAHMHMQSPTSVHQPCLPPAPVSRS